MVPCCTSRSCRPLLSILLLVLRSQLAAKEQELAAAVTTLEAVEREAASMASAYDDDLAALTKQRSDLLDAQNERDAALQQLTARRLEASQAMSAAEADCANMTAEARPDQHLLHSSLAATCSAARICP
jgi:septal ring factor EnvC (AmiA/AmiB activator)